MTLVAAEPWHHASLGWLEDHKLGPAGLPLRASGTMSEPGRGAVERRTARSDDTLIALARMLEAVRHLEKLEAIAVGDDAGLLLAFAGEAELCAELAATAPLRATAANDTAEERGRIAADGRHVERLRVAGAELFVSGFGARLEPSLRAVIAGCERILAPKPRLAR